MIINTGWIPGYLQTSGRLLNEGLKRKRSGRYSTPKREEKILTEEERTKNDGHIDNKCLLKTGIICLIGVIILISIGLLLD